LEIINITLVITIVPEIAIWIIISPVIIITIRINYVLYIKDSNTTSRNIYRRNKRLKRLDLEPEIFINLRLRISINLIKSLVISIYN
jgi:hypothetical protein